MSKITIVSRGDQALLIDISGCSTFKEAVEQLSSAFLSANEFWQEQTVDLNLGSLLLTKPQAAQIVALANGVGAKPNQVFAGNIETIKSLQSLEISVSSDKPSTVSTVALTSNQNVATKENGQEKKSNQQKNSGTSCDKSKIEQVIVFDSGAQATSPLNTEEQGIEASYELSDSACATELETREDIVVSDSQGSESSKSSKPVALYIRQTLRAGQAVSHKGDLIIIGDVNAGAEVMAEGDIIIWGSLRGIAHAGIAGNTKAEIRALRLQPIQIRIANYIARSPDGQNAISASGQNQQYAAEIAKLVNGKIRILRNTFEG